MAIAFYDANKLEKIDVRNIKLFVMLICKVRPGYKELKEFKKMKDKFQTVIGQSFILHPERLLTSTVDIIYIYQYLILASRRSYLLYKRSKITYLDLSLFPDIILDNIKYNPLLRIENGKIYFKLEE